MKTLKEILKELKFIKKELQAIRSSLELPKKDIAGIISDGVQKAVQSAIRGTCVKAEL